MEPVILTPDQAAVIVQNIIGMNDLVIVTRKEIWSLQRRVDELLVANNNEIAHRRSLEQELIILKTKQLPPIKPCVCNTQTITDTKPSSRTFENVTRNIIKTIQFMDDLSEQSGSCGDGNFDQNNRKLDHKYRLITVNVLKRDILGEK